MIDIVIALGIGFWVGGMAGFVIAGLMAASRD